jgi:hypothetical protein
MDGYLNGNYALGLAIDMCSSKFRTVSSVSGCFATCQSGPESNRIASRHGLDFGSFAEQRRPVRIACIFATFRWVSSVRLRGVIGSVAAVRYRPTFDVFTYSNDG